MLLGLIAAIVSIIACLLNTISAVHSKRGSPEQLMWALIAVAYFVLFIFDVSRLLEGI